MRKRNEYWFLLFLIIVPVIYPSSCAAEENGQSYQLEPIFIHSAESKDTSLGFHQENQAEDALQGLPELLNKFSAVDVSKRLPFNMLSDVQVRGGSFEDTDILVDGILVNDPQTGHFNLDLPLFTEDVDKIMMISSSSFSNWGIARPGGAVYIKTKKPEEEKLIAKANFGSHKYSGQVLSSSYKINKINSRSTLGRSSSCGYRYNTDFDQLGFSHISELETGCGDLDFSFHFQDKEFGANGYYTEFYPEQREHTKTILSSLSLSSGSDNFNLSPKLYLRRHQDRYLLDRTRPWYLENFHTSFSCGAKTDITFNFSQSQLLTGLDLAQENLKSTNLGKHKRPRDILYAKYNTQIDRLLFACGLTGNFYEQKKGYLLPELGFGYWLKEDFKIRSTYNLSFRPPSFTELYYQSPANVGNKDLVPEKAKNYELGFDYEKTYASTAVSIFKREGKNLIDWVRGQTETTYQAKNIAVVDTYGIELASRFYPARISPGLKNWQELYFGYTYLEREEQEKEFISKYVFDYLKHKFILGSSQKLVCDLILNLNLTYKQRIEKGADFILDSKVSRAFKRYKFFIQIDNVFNHAYADQGNLPMPGRWLIFGLEANW